MDTLVYLDKKSIKRYIDSKCNDISNFNKQLMLLGFPYALEVNENNFNKVKRNLLICNNFTNHKILPETNEFVDVLMKSFRVFERTNAVLKECEYFGDVSLVSNYYSILRPVINKYFNQNVFKHILLSCDEGEIKPSEKLLKKLKIEEYQNSYYFGDNWRSDIIPALNEGFHCIYLHNDRFIDFIMENGIQSLIEKNNDKYCFKKKYKKLANYYFNGLIDVNDIKERDMYIYKLKVYLKIFDLIKIYPSIDCIKRINEVF